MAKRELIDKEKFIKNAGKLRVSEFEYDYIIDGLNRAKVPEEEVVRPYLKKLNEHIINFPWSDTSDGFMTGVNAVCNLIDNLLTEKGAEE